MLTAPSPLFILALGLSPEIAIGTGLITKVFGFASGVYAYARQRLGILFILVAVLTLEEVIL